MHLPLRPISASRTRILEADATPNASKIWAQLNKKSSTQKSSTKRFREYIIFKECEGEYHAAIPIVGVKKIKHLYCFTSQP